MAISIRLKIKTLYNDFSPKERLIADYILAHPDTISKKPISSIAHELNIADSTLFQFTKKLGFSGFKDFKMALLVQENANTSVSFHEHIEKDDSELSMAQKVFESNISTLNDTKMLLKEADLKNAAKIMNHASSIFFFGIGGSEIVASDAYHKFLRSPLRVFHSSDYHIQLMEASLLKTDDCAVLISHTGRSSEMIHLAETVKKTGAKFIVITSQANSPLAQMADIVFISISEETEFRSEALSSRFSQLSILDSLYIILMFYNQEKAEESMTKVRETISRFKK